MATSLTIGRATLRQAAAAMALVMMVASLPSIGVIVIADTSGPSISMDVCHPLQALDSSPNVVVVARPALPDFGARIFSSETLADSVPVFKIGFAETPDPPPPKLLS